MTRYQESRIKSSEQERIVSRWLDALMGTYPEESARFFSDTRDPFANPVGAAFKKGIKELFEVVAADSYDQDAARMALEPVVRVRAVQDFTPSEALGFITEIKSITAGSGACGKSAEQIAENADRALLTGFDIYMECKRQVYELRARQSRDAVRQLLIKKELISQLPDIDPELTG